MSLKLQIELIRFDAKMDYLPYSARVEILSASPSKEGLVELYHHIKAKIPDFGFEERVPYCKINGRIVYKNVTITEIVEGFGSSITLEPIAPKWALKDLIIDKNPYVKALFAVDEILDLSEEDLDYYRAMLPFRFASSLALSDEEYLGEAFFLFVAEMARRYPKESTRLLALLSDPQKGVMKAIPLRARLFPLDDWFDVEIETLQRKILQGYPHQESRWKNLRESVVKSFGAGGKR